MALSSSMCSGSVYPHYCDHEGVSVLENIVSLENEPNKQQVLVGETVGEMIPVQFGYVFEVSADNGNTWVEVNHRESGTGGGAKKISVSSQLISFDYSGLVEKPLESKFDYLTCQGGYGLVTCGSGHEDPSVAGDLVPSASAKVVRLTVFI